MLHFLKSFKLKSIILYLSIIGIIYLPELFIYLKSNTLTPFIEGFIFTLIFFSIPIVLFFRKLILYYIFLCFIMILSFVALFCMYYFNTNITKELIVMLKDTNQLEIIDLFKLYFYPIIFSFIFALVLFYLLIKQLPSKVNFKKALYISSFSTLILILMSFYRYHTHVSISKAPISRVTYYSLIEYHPFSILGHITGLRKDFELQENYLNVLNSYKFNSKRIKKNNKREIVVLCIGETSRYQNWELNGYNRKTNPRLSKRDDLFVYSDFITAAGYTRGSVPIIITRAEPENYFLHLKEPSFLRVLKEVGFNTYWISAQEKFGWNSSPNSIHVADADSNYYALYNKNIDIEDRDMSLLDNFSKVLDNDTGDVCIILHTLGSHFTYDERYPDHFKKFTPTLKDIGGDLNNIRNSKDCKPALWNSYDNTIVQSDAFLDSAINILNRKDAISSLLFVSDHGENLCDNDQFLVFHPDPPTEYVIHIPGIVWLSPLYKIFNKEQTTRLESNINSKISTINIFHTILDMFNIRIESYDSTKSFANKDFLPRERTVFGYDSIRSYDKLIKYNR